MARLCSDEALAAMTIWLEAGGEPQAGRVGVAEVIRNRMHRHGRTLAAILFQPWQFSCWNTDDPRRAHAMQLEEDAPGVTECLLAWKTAREGSTVVQGALYYLNPEVTVVLRAGTLPPWATDPSDSSRLDESLVTARIGRHAFLRERPRRG